MPVTYGVSPMKKAKLDRMSLTQGAANLPNHLNKTFLSPLSLLLWQTLPIDWAAPGSQALTPNAYTDPASFARHYLASEILSKLDDGLPSVRKEEETWRRFHAAEEMCRLTNERLKQPSFGPNPFNGRSPYSAILLARQKMETLLGAFSWEEASDRFGWGPGATTRIKRRNSAATNKFSGRPETTIGNHTLAEAAIRHNPLWLESVRCPNGEGSFTEIVGGNVIITVPKSYKTHRTIAIEPCMNGYVQKGIGACIRHRLRRAGVNLDDQSKNQRMAKIGSFTGSLATIDLSMASDCLAYSLVEMLVPPDWFDALEQSRSPLGMLPSGDFITYQKFSSMGNGYTFELETAIFYCLALAVAELVGEKDPRITVYGDDIICPTNMAVPLIAALSVAGFEANPSKTFYEGPFRESCGKHYFQGHEVTPFYVKSVASSEDDVYLLHNQLYRWCSRVQPFMDVSLFYELVVTLRSCVRKAWQRPRIPDNFGDGAFIGSFDEAHPTFGDRHGVCGYWVKHRVDISEPSLCQPTHLGRLVSSLSASSRNCATSDWWEMYKRGRLDGNVPGGGLQETPRRATTKSLVRSFPPIIN